MGWTQGKDNTKRQKKKKTLKVLFSTYSQESMIPYWRRGKQNAIRKSFCYPK